MHTELELILCAANIGNRRVYFQPRTTQSTTGPMRCHGSVMGQTDGWITKQLKSFRVSYRSAWKRQPVSESSYLINGAPAPVLIDVPKLGFHRGQSSCHSCVFVPRYGHPSRWIHECPAVADNCSASVRERRLPCYLTAWFWRKHAAGSSYTVKRSSSAG